MEIRHLGISNNYVSIRNMTVGVIGLGRIGSRVAQQLARMGFGTIIVIDKGMVQTKHVQSCAYYREHIGLSKVQATRLSIHEINPDVHVIGETLDLLNTFELDFLEEVILQANIASHALEELTSLDRKEHLKGKSGIADLLISCLDSLASRKAMNTICMRSGISLFNSQMHENGKEATINLVIPGQTACLECIHEKAQASSHPSDQHDSISSKCDAPGVAMMVSGQVVQSALQFLLKFGTVNAGFRYRSQADSKLDDVDTYTPSKEYLCFPTEPYALCTEPRCREKAQMASV